MKNIAFEEECERMMSRFKEKKSDFINITVMVKGDGFKSVAITPKMLIELASSIKGKGYEHLHLASGSIEIDGFMVIGKQTGERLIVIGKSEAEVAV